MAQDTNHLLQSYTDILGVNDTPRYDGVSPIQVDNINDTISINPGALSKIEPTNTVHVEQTTNNAGNLVYKLHVTHDAGKSYQGVYPVDVNNQTNEISVNNVGLDLQFPLFGTVDNDILTLGSKFGNYYYPSTAATGASILVSEINSMEYWCETNGDKSFRIRHDGALDPVGFGYTLPELPPTGGSKYLYGGDRQWHVCNATTTTVYLDTITATATVDTTQGYQEFDFGNMLECNYFEIDYLIRTTLASVASVTPHSCVIETFVNGNSFGERYFEIVNGTAELYCEFYSRTKSSSYSSLPQVHSLKVRIYNASNTWKNGSTQTVSAQIRRYVWNTI